VKGDARGESCNVAKKITLRGAALVASADTSQEEEVVYEGKWPCPPEGASPAFIILELPTRVARGALPAREIYPKECYCMEEKKGATYRPSRGGKQA